MALYSVKKWKYTTGLLFCTEQKNVGRFPEKKRLLIGAAGQTYLGY